VREAARLQTFDDDYKFISPNMSNYKMIGNAVPPKFSLILAKALKQIIEKYGLEE
jgi:Site-specific DNA methylase